MKAEILMAKGLIAELPAADQEKVKAVAAELQAVTDKAGPHGMLGSLLFICQTTESWEKNQGLKLPEVQS